MADSGLGNIIGIGAVAVGGYLLWNWFTTPTSPTAATTGGVVPSTTPPATSATTQAPTTTSANLSLPVSQMLIQKAAGNAFLTGSGPTATFNPWQWETIYNELGLPALNQNTFNSQFFANGIPSDPSAFPQITAAQFATAMGLSGFGGGYTRGRTIRRFRG